MHRFILANGWVVPMTREQFESATDVALNYDLAGTIVVYPTLDQSILLRVNEVEVIEVTPRGGIC